MRGHPYIDFYNFYDILQLAVLRNKYLLLLLFLLIKEFQVELKINAILSEEAKSRITEVFRQTWYGGKPGTETELYIGKTRVVIRQGVVQSELPTEGPISKEILEFIVGVRVESTLNEALVGVTREKGKYVLPSNHETTGTVELYMKDVLNITCYGPNRELTLWLHELVRSGQIHPEVSYEKPTEGPTRQQLVDLTVGLEADLRLAHGELAITEAKLAAAEKERDDLKQKIEGLQTERDRLAGELAGTWKDLETKNRRLKAIFVYVRDLEMSRVFWAAKKTVRKIIADLDTIGNPPVIQ